MKFTKENNKRQWHQLHIVHQIAASQIPLIEVTSQRGTIHDQRDHLNHDNNCHVSNQQRETQTVYLKGSNGLRLQRERSRRNECQRRFLRASGYPSTLRHRRRPFPLRVAVHPT